MPAAVQCSPSGRADPVRDAEQVRAVDLGDRLGAAGARQDQVRRLAALGGEPPHAGPRELDEVGDAEVGAREPQRGRTRRAIGRSGVDRHEPVALERLERLLERRGSVSAGLGELAERARRALEDGRQRPGATPSAIRSDRGSSPAGGRA